MGGNVEPDRTVVLRRLLDIGVLLDTERIRIASLRRLRAAGRGEAVLGRERMRDESVDEGLGFFEITFLTMQRKIFEDQALMHEAYLGGGLDAIRALSARRESSTRRPFRPGSRSTAATPRASS